MPRSDFVKLGKHQRKTFEAVFASSYATTCNFVGTEGIPNADQCFIRGICILHDLDMLRCDRHEYIYARESFPGDMIGDSLGRIFLYQSRGSTHTNNTGTPDSSSCDDIEWTSIAGHSILMECGSMILGSEVLMVSHGYSCKCKPPKILTTTVNKFMGRLPADSSRCACDK